MRSRQPYILVLAISAISCFANPAPEPQAAPGGGTTTQSTGSGTQAPSNNGFQWVDTWSTTLVGGNWNNTDTQIRAMTDFDGDGLPDLMALDPNDFYFAKNISTTFASPKSLRDDFTAAAGWTSENSTPLLFGDVNGDLKADIVGLGQDEVFCNVSTGTDTIGETSFNSVDVFTSKVGYTTQETMPRFLGDVNGDGRADLVGINDTGVWVSLSDTNTFAASVLWSADFMANNGWTSQDTTPRMLADVNGDGMLDIVGFGPNGVAVALSETTHFDTTSIVSTEFVGANWPNNQTYPRFAADVNGDGKADFVGIDDNGVHVALGEGAQNAEPSYIAYTGFQPSAGWTSQVQTPRFVLDLNGDKKADIIGFQATGITVVLNSFT